MHTFKRIYLLASLVTALLIPALVFNEYVEVLPTTYVTTQEYSISQATTGPIGIPQALEKDALDIEPILWTVYFIGVLFFGVKFLKNLIQIIQRIGSNPKQKWEQFIYVLLRDQLPPHTFLSYIFLNQPKFEAKEIPEEVLLHEQTHARQKHSYDILFVEFLQVVFWINPFIYFIKKAIKLNHEFLADEAVLNKNISKAHYQNTLLSYLSEDNKHHQSPLVNPINYSSIKKRFTIMKRQTSKKAIVLRSILVLPLLAVLTYSFSETDIIPIEKDDIKEELINLNELDTSYSKNHNQRKIQLGGLIMDSETLKPLANAEFRDGNGNVLSTTDKNGYYNVALQVSAEGELIFDFSLYKEGYQPLHQKERWGNLPGKIGSSYYFGLKKEGSESKEISELGGLTTNLSYEAILSQYAPIKARIAFNQKINSIRKNNQQTVIEIDQDYYLINNTGWIKLNSPKELIIINDKKIVPASELNKHVYRNEVTGMTPLEETNKAHFAIYTLANSKIKAGQNGLSTKELAEYNKLAKHYNSMPQNKMKIYKKDVERLKYLFSKMSEDQKNVAEPFPDFPEPPPAPKAPKGLNEREEAAHIIEEIIEKQDPYDVVNTGIIINPKGKKVVSHENSRVYIHNSETSSNNENGLEKYVTSIDLKNAQFYFEGEKISSKKGLEIIKNRIDIKVETIPYTNKLPEVRIYKSESEGTIPPPPHPPESPEVIKGKASSIPTPPEPVTPLDHIISMAKKDAIFLFEGNEISSDEAIDLIKTNKDLNIDSRTVKGKKPVVIISKSPFD